MRHVELDVALVVNIPEISGGWGSWNQVTTLYISHILSHSKPAQWNTDGRHVYRNFEE